MDCKLCKWSLGIAVTALVCLEGMPIMAAVIYVDADASSGGDGTSWGQAYDDLQDAFSEPPSSGDEIWVAAGTYRPGTNRTDSFHLVDGVDVYGGFDGTEAYRLECTGTSTSCTDDTDCTSPATCDDERDIAANVTTLASKSGQGKTYQIVVVDDCDTAGCRLDGFTITGGVADGNYFFPPLGPNDGAGIFVDGGTLDLANCIVIRNSANDKGGGVYVIGGATLNVFDCIFDTNDATLSGGGIYNTSDNLEVANSIFIRNDAPFGGGMFTTGDASVLNCTFATNTTLTAGRGAGINVGTADATIRNSIFWGNVGGGTSTNESDQVAGTTVDIIYSCVQGCSSGSGGICETGTDKNIGSDPLFLDAPNNLHVRWGSRTIDGGDSDEVDWDEDSEGNDRKCDTPWMPDSGDATSGDVVDMGVYEVCGTIVYVDTSAEGNNDGTSWTHAYTDFQSALSNATAPGEIWAADGTYKPSVTNPSSSNAREETFLLPSGVAIFGGFAGTETNRAECSGGTDPCFDDSDCTGTCVDERSGNATILSGDLDGDDAINESDCGNEDDAEWNSGGSYCERIFTHGDPSQTICENLYGQTWISSESKCQFNTGIALTNNDDNCLHVVTADSSSANAVIDGFTITAGNADRKGFCAGGDNPDALCDNDLPDCDGTAETPDGTCKTLHNQGGGLQLRAVASANVIDNDITVRNCTFSGNVVKDHGGGFNDHGLDTVTHNCIFEENYSDKRGAGLYLHNSAEPTVTDCTFRYNTALTTGGALYIEDNGDPTITDCVFAYNMTKFQGGGAVWVDGGGPTFNGCQFLHNSSSSTSGTGGCVYVANGASIFDGCTFVECVSISYGGALGYAGLVDVGDVKNSVFVRNSGALGGGVATEQGGYDPDIASCVFVGNYANRGLTVGFDFGGAIFHGANAGGESTVSNSLLAGNSAAGSGAVAATATATNSGSVFTNCTVVDNETTGGPAFRNTSGGSSYMSFVNSIVQRNVDYTGSDNSFGSSTPDDFLISYSNIAGSDGTDTATCEGTPKECVGGFYDGMSCSVDEDCQADGVIDASADDIFLAAVEENWDLDGVGSDDTASFDADTYETTFTDISKSASEWDNDELKGLVFHLRREIVQTDYSVVTRSSGNTFTVWGNLKDEFDALADDKPYAILDYQYVACAEGVDAGDNDGLPADITDVDNDGNTTETLPTDLDGSTRKVNDTGVTDTGNGTAPIVDMGAYEKQTNSSSCP